MADRETGDPEAEAEAEVGGGSKVRLRFFWRAGRPVRPARFFSIMLQKALGRSLTAQSQAAQRPTEFACPEEVMRVLFGR